MNCKKCGNLLGPNDVFCNKCGEPVSAPTVAPEPQPITPTNEIPNNNLNQTPQPVNPVNEQPQVVNPTPVGGPTNVVSNNQTPKKDNKLKIIIIVLALVVVAVGAFIVYKLLNSSNETPPANETPSSNETQPSGNSETVNNGGAVGNTYNYKGFQFILPNGYTASEYNDEFIIRNATTAAQIMVAEYYTLDDIKPQAEALKEGFIKQGMMVTGIETKTYAGKEWLLMPATVTEEGSTYALTIAFTDLGEYHLSRIYVVSKNPSDETIYTEIVNMFSTATYNGTTSFSKDGKKGELNVKTVPDKSIFKNESGE